MEDVVKRLKCEQRMSDKMIVCKKKKNGLKKKIDFFTGKQLYLKILLCGAPGNITPVSIEKYTLKIVILCKLSCANSCCGK